MKKNAVVGLVLTLISQLAFTQVTDTLGYDNFLTGTPTLYASPNGGHAFGNNGYQDKAKAQSYFHDRPFVLRHVLLQFGEVTFSSADSSSTIRVNVYDNHGFGVTSVGASDSIAPDSVLAFVELPVYELLDNGALTIADVSDDSLLISERFSVGIDLTYLVAGDTVGLMSTTDGDADDTYDAWELVANGTWFTVEEPTFSWGLDVDLAIFPVIDENDPAGVGMIKPTSFSLYPNPCEDQLFVNVGSAVMRGMTYTIHDVSGRMVAKGWFPLDKAALDVSFLDLGVYVITVQESHRSHTARFIKQ